MIRKLLSQEVSSQSRCISDKHITAFPKWTNQKRRASEKVVKNGSDRIFHKWTYQVINTLLIWLSKRAGQICQWKLSRIIDSSSHVLIFKLWSQKINSARQLYGEHLGLRYLHLQQLKYWGNISVSIYDAILAIYLQLSKK